MPDFVQDSKKKIVIFLGRHNSPASGLWTYALSVVREITTSDAFEEYQTIHFVLGVPKRHSDVYLSPLRELVKTDPAKFKIMPLFPPLGSRRLGVFFDKFRLRSYASKVELIHGLCNDLPDISGVKRVVTINDLFQGWPLIPERGVYFAIRRLFYRLRTLHILSNVDLIITISPHMRVEIEKRTENSVQVFAITPPMKRLFLEQNTRTICLPEKYLLAFVSDDPRKNGELLLKAFAKLNREDISLHFVVSGERIRRKLVSLARSLRIEKQVVFHSNPSDDELVVLTSKALGLAFASLAEGFGYPIYEALLCGVPVLSRGEFVLPELKKKLSQPEAVVACGCEEEEELVAGLLELMVVSKITDRSKLKSEVHEFFKELEYAKGLKAAYDAVIYRAS